MSIFLDKADIKKLTGKTHKSCQVAILRDMGIPFRINAANEPVVTVSAVEGGKVEQLPKTWQSNVLTK